LAGEKDITLAALTLHEDKSNRSIYNKNDSSSERVNVVVVVVVVGYLHIGIIFISLSQFVVVCMATLD